MEIQKMLDQINLLKGYISGLEWVIEQAKKEEQSSKIVTPKEG